VRTLKTIVAGKDIRDEGQARVAFWERLEASNGGRLGDPRDYIEITGVTQEAGGFVFRYEVPAELLEKGVQLVSDAVPEPKPRPKCHVLSCLNPCIEGSSYCAEHQTSESRAESRGAPATTGNAEPVFESFDREQPVPVKDVLITGWNPRKAFDADALQSLADDIRQNGLINAVTVRPKGKSKYELVAGERRLRAFRLLGRATIPAKVRELTDEQVLNIMLSENLHRVDLNPIEKAHHLKRVLEVGKLTQTELGRRLGKSQEWVSLRLRLAEAPAALQDLIICRQINTSSAIEVLQWKNTEHYDAIMQEVIAWSVAGEELPRARVREIIKEITEPSAPYGSQLFPVAAFVREGEIEPGTIVVLNTDGTVAPANLPEPKDPTCVDCGNSTWSRGELVCAHHGPVHPKGRYCEKFVAPSLGGDDDPVDDEDDGCEMFGQPGAADDEVCAVDCPDYEECKAEGAEEDDDQDLPQELEPVVEPENEPAVQNEKNEGLMVTERPEDFFGNKGVPEIVDKHSRHGYHGRLIGSSNGDLQVETGERKKPYYEDLGAIVAKAIGCIEGDKVPIAVDVTRGTITIRRRGKF
jgi:ParB family transcriptional regulator, chromosome partitioning protein